MPYSPAEIEEIIEYHIIHGPAATKDKYGVSKNFAQRRLRERGTTAYKVMCDRVAAVAGSGGYTAPQIAARLGVSVFRVEHILQKLGYKRGKLRHPTVDADVAAQSARGHMSPTTIAMITGHPYHRVYYSMEMQGLPIRKSTSVAWMLEGVEIPDEVNVTRAIRVLARRYCLNESTVRRITGLNKWNYRQRLSATTTPMAVKQHSASSG